MTQSARFSVNKLIVLALITLACSCDKNKPQPKTPVNRLIPSEMRAYWDFKPGTFWIYQDSASGLLDTVTVTGYYNDTFQSGLSYDSDIMAICEMLSISTLNSNGSVDDYGINTAHASTDYANGNIVRHARSNNPDFENGTTNCFVYPFVTGNISYLSNGFISDACAFKSISDSAFGFEKVVTISNTYNMAEGDQPTHTFWANEVGLIRKVLPSSGRTYKLVYYHINH